MIAVAVGDPEATRTVYAVVIALAAIGVVLMIVAVWLIRQTRVDPELLAPLERMDTRRWERRDPATQRRMLDEVRPPGAEPLHRERAVPAVDEEFEAELPAVAGFDDLKDGANLAPTPAGASSAEFDGSAGAEGGSGATGTTGAADDEASGGVGAAGAADDEGSGGVGAAGAADDEGSGGVGAAGAADDEGSGAAGAAVDEGSGRDGSVGAETETDADAKTRADADEATVGPTEVAGDHEVLVEEAVAAYRVGEGLAVRDGDAVAAGAEDVHEAPGMPPVGQFAAPRGDAVATGAEDVGHAQVTPQAEKPADPDEPRPPSSGDPADDERTTGPGDAGSEAHDSRAAAVETERDAELQLEGDPHSAGDGRRSAVVPAQD